MNTTPLKTPAPIQDTKAPALVTQAMVQACAQDIAKMAGRLPAHATQADYQQAMRELTGQPEDDVQDTVVEAIPEVERLDSVTGTEGRQAPESTNEDEDEEGRSESEQMFDVGVEEADRERKLQAGRAIGDKGEKTPS